IAWMGRVAGLARAERPDTQASALARVWTETREGLQALVQNRTILAVGLVFAVAMLGLGAINVLAVAYLTRTFGIAPGGLGLLQTTQAIGLIVGSIAAGQWLANARPGRVMAAGMTVVGVC